MKRNEQLIIGSIALVGLIAAFWLLVLSPKREQASQLQDEIDGLQSSLTQAQQDISTGRQAQKAYPVDYRRMVVLGKAVPADGEQTSLLVQLQDLANRSGVDFQSIDLGSSSSSAASAVAPTTSTSSTDTSTSDSSDASAETSSPSSSSTDTSTAAPASEASAALLPIGATVGPAGLPIMPYELTFSGDFFQIADFMKRLDALVDVRGGAPDVQGRLLTVDGFTLTASDEGSATNPRLTADLSVTTFLTPADQGITAGATPTGPAAGMPSLTSSSTSTDSSSTTESTSSTSPTSTTAP